MLGRVYGLSRHEPAAWLCLYFDFADRQSWGDPVSGSVQAGPLCAFAVQGVGLDPGCPALLGIVEAPQEAGLKYSAPARVNPWRFHRRHLEWEFVPPCQQLHGPPGGQAVAGDSGGQFPLPSEVGNGSTLGTSASAAQGDVLDFQSRQTTLAWETAVPHCHLPCRHPATCRCALFA